MMLALTQGTQQRGNLGHAGRVQRRADKILQLDIFVVLLQGCKAVLFMYHTNDIVDRIVVDRQAGVAALGEALNDLVHRGIILDSHYIHAGGKHILRLHIVKLDGAADQLTFTVRSARHPSRPR